MNLDEAESHVDEDVWDELEDDVPDRFDLDRWREDLRERSTRRRWMRERDLKRGLYDPPTWIDHDDFELDE